LLRGVSLLTLYRRLLALRRRTPALAVSTYTPILADADVLAYTRAHHGQRYLVVLNLGPHPQHLESAALRRQVALSTHLDRPAEVVRGSLTLRGDEGVIIAWSQYGRRGRSDRM
jgi:alpha-glucosidase